MASYSNINGIKSITTGDEAGTWGTSTNTNLEILDAAGRGYKKITMSDSDLTLPMDNNPTAVENGHYFGIEFSGSNTASRTIIIEQNDHALVYAFLNNTGQDLVIRQGDGTGGTVTIGDTNGAIVFCDGAGTGAKVTNLSSALNTSSADQLTNARDFSITGDITAAAVSFNGTANVALSAAITAGSIVNADINSSAAIADTKLATISTASKVANSATTATNLNTASAIVARDGSGNFAAGTITAALTGNVTGDLTGDVYASNGTSKILESGTDGTDATFTGAVTGTVSGNAGTATALASAQNFSITGDITAAAVSFDGTGAVALSAAITADTIVNADIKSDAAIADTKLATISTSGKVSNSATTATNANTASAIVARDSSGNFSAGTITATLSGNATTATSATTAGTVTTAAQPNITSLGTLTTLTVDDITINGSTISDADALAFDIGTDLTIDVDGGDIFLKDGGTQRGSIDVATANTVKHNVWDGAAYSEEMRLTTSGVNVINGLRVGDSTAPTDNDIYAAADIEAANNLTAGNEIVMSGGASNWTFEVDASNNLIIQYGGTSLMKLDSSGNLTVTGDVTAFGTIS